MKNLEQVRARNALDAIKRIKNLGNKAQGEEGGDVLTGFPALIVNNGLLSTLAFSKSKSKKEKSGHEIICDEIACHLASNEVNLLDGKKGNTGELLNHLTNSDSDQLRLCTSEALAYLNYLRRFAKAEE